MTGDSYREALMLHTTTLTAAAGEWTIELAGAERCAVSMALSGQAPTLTASWLVRLSGSATPVPVEPTRTTTNSTARLYEFEDLPPADALILVYWGSAEAGGSPSVELTARTQR